MIIFLAILMCLLLAASAFFSGSETALFSINVNTLQNWHEEGTPGQKAVARLMDDHHSTLTTILLGNCFVNILSVVVLDKLLLACGYEDKIIRFWVTVALSTALLLAIGELTPKAIAYSASTYFAPRVAPAIAFLTRILSVFVRLLKAVSGFVLRVVSGREDSTAISIEEYETFTRLAHRMGVFDAAEVEMFDRVFNMRQVHVSQFMVPRPEVKTIDVNLDLSELNKRIKEYCHRFVPVIDGGMDRLKGIFDVIRYANLPEDEQGEWRDTCIVEPLYVPENGKTHTILGQLRDRQQGMAIVVNEYGGVEGLITAEDIYEQMVGELTDEYDAPLWYVHLVQPGHWRVSGLIPLTQLHEELELELPNSKAETLGGLLAEQLERIPDTGEAWEHESFRFEVRRVHRKRVLEVDVFDSRKAGGAS